MKPVWGRLTVLPDDIEETDEKYKSAKQAGIYIPESEEKERQQYGQVEGKIIAVGGNCFEDWNEPIPQPGDRVVFDKFAGFIKKYKGQEIRIISDTDIFAILGE